MNRRLTHTSSSPNADTTHGDAVNVAVDVEEGRLITGNTGVSVGNNEGDLQMQVGTAPLNTFSDNPSPTTSNPPPLPSLCLPYLR